MGHAGLVCAATPGSGTGLTPQQVLCKSVMGEWMSKARFHWVSTVVLSKHFVARPGALGMLNLASCLSTLTHS